MARGSSVAGSEAADRASQTRTAHRTTQVTPDVSGSVVPGLGKAPLDGALLRAPGIQPAQRQALAAQIGGVQGNRGLQRLVLAGQTGQASVPAPGSSLIQRDVLDAIGDALDIRQDEAALDEWEDYQEATEDLRDFRSEIHTAENFQSTTRIGMFDAAYFPSLGTLMIEVRCQFNFVDGSAAEFPSAAPEDLTWTDDAAKDAWKARFLATVSTAWTFGNFAFYCQKPWWESLVANVLVDVHEAEADPHFVLTITKIPSGEFRGSSVTSPVVLPVWGATGPGTADFDSEDLETVAKPGGMQTPAIHETGHMLGLDDEYIASGPEPPSHSDMVESEFGQGVAKGTDGRVMSGGDDIQPEHGITFLAALKEATGMEEWSATMCAVPRPIPTNPRAAEGMGDFPVPSGDTRLA
ncbi:MAG: hypothetical protein MUF84_14605 [Anaerolineae bacterium]|nr:hypothetical protein [Anaerolineae bacterium]